MKNKYYPQFRPGDRVVSLVYHPPEIISGTKATIISPQFGKLYAVELPDGQLHGWVAEFELRPLNTRMKQLESGDSAVVLNDVGHHHIERGMIVKIVKGINTYFYDIRLEDGSYHRWLAEFELAFPI